MGEILINHEQVYQKTSELKHYINNDLITQIKNEYGQIQSMLDKFDGATNASLKKTMDQNLRKSLMGVQMLDRLLSFMANSAKEFERSDKEMSDAIASGAKDTQGGEK